jgi:glutamate racemase
LLGEEIMTAWPGIALVDGGQGIARRIAYLTAGQPWPSEASPGIAVFTAAPPASLSPALARFGLDQMVTL